MPVKSLRLREWTLIIKTGKLSIICVIFITITVFTQSHHNFGSKKGWSLLTLTSFLGKFGYHFNRTETLADLHQETQLCCLNSKLRINYIPIRELRWPTIIRFFHPVFSILSFKKAKLIKEKKHAEKNLCHLKKNPNETFIAFEMHLECISLGR